MRFRTFVPGLLACGCLAFAGIAGDVDRTVDTPFAADAPAAITLTYTFDRPTISTVKIDDTAYDRVTMPDAPNGGNAGQPALPACGASILLPFGCDVSSVEVVAGGRVVLGQDYNVEPVSQGVRLSALVEESVAPTPDPTIYNMDQPFPNTLHERIGTHSFRGYQILTLKLHPVQYNPVSGELSYSPSMTVRVNTVDHGAVSALYRGLEKDEHAVRSKVDNPGIAASYPATGVRGDKGYDLLILTTTSLAPAFGPLKAYHDANGMLTEIHTTVDYGSTSPDNLRSYVTDRYNNDGIEYVIIGGDDDILPAKNLYVMSSPSGYTEYNMPTDMYIGCLDGTYNYDGDSYWGEPTDGDGGGDVDLVAEVYVGRASADNTTEVTRFVDKTIGYLSNQHAHIENILLVGEYLGFGGPAEYAAPAMNQLIDGSSADGYTTVGIPSDIYSIDTLYEQDGAWSQADLVTRINNGLHVINHLGHGAIDYAMHLYNSDILSQLTNDDHCFVYSQTCSAGHFDGAECWAETINLKTDAGAFGVVMNARYGWGKFNSTDGASQRFNREFWDAVFDPGEGSPQMGRANADSKEDNIYRINEDQMRWCTYGLNLFGDPTVAFAGVTGMRVSPGGDFESEGPNGGPFMPDNIVYTLHNMSDAGIDYSVTKSASWLTLTNANGYIPADGSALVTATINASATTLPNGVYVDPISFINQTTHEGDTTRDAVLTVGAPVVVYDWPMDTNPGWTTEGQWAFGDPTGQGGEYGGPDPNSGYTGANVYGYNLNGDYANYMSETHLTSTAIDCTDLMNVTLKFRRWLGVEQPAYDHAYVRVSNNGSDWTTVWENGSEITDSSWQEIELDISAVADDQPTVYLRWTMGTTDTSWRYCGWNIDDVQIKAIESSEPCLGDLDGDGYRGQSDLGLLLAAYENSAGGDVDGDGDTDQEDLGLLLSVYDEPCP
ncbi:MAG: hypothetical protein KAS72_03265 [Phycisphaerales bacterium]|nr:hypothetical protein [Phycisphaerales bacterium]